MAGVIAPAVFQQRAIGKLAGVVFDCFGKTQRQVITTHIAVGTTFVTHIAATGGTEHFCAATTSYLHGISDAAAGNSVGAAVDKRCSGYLGLYW